MIYREQIIEILERFITESDDYPDCILKYNFSRVADDILALPLDVPSRVETLLKSSDNEVYVNDQQRIGFQKGVAWAIDEIIKRNQKLRQ